MIRSSKTYRIAIWAFKDTFWAYQGQISAVSPGQMFVLPFCLFIAALTEILIGPDGAPGGRGAVGFWIMMVIPLGILLDIVLTVTLKSLGEWRSFETQKAFNSPTSSAVSAKN